MKKFRFALLGMVVILYLLYSCSHEEKDHAEQAVTGEEVMDDEAANEEETPGEGTEEHSGAENEISSQEDDELEPDDEEYTEPSDHSSSNEGNPGGDGASSDNKPDEDRDPYSAEEDTMILNLLINELRITYSKPKVEYIEFKIISSGNLGGVRVFAASNHNNPLLYEFAPVDVKKGDYITLHLRTPDAALCVNEYGSNLAESGGEDSSINARDFWVPGSVKLLRDTDIIYALAQDDSVLDAVLITNKPDLMWSEISKQDYYSEIVESLFNHDAWKSADGNMPAPADAVNSSKTTSTQTICRDETIKDTNTASDWYIAARSSSTPGQRNNPKRL
ncbi:MAG: hypothetical protein FWC03_02770 [Treponema sp.]|nr:hypothetical protein [Treponema sp.]